MQEFRTGYAISSGCICMLAHRFLKVDGYLARKYKMQSVLGTILDPAADKALMTTLTVSLAMRDLLPGIATSTSQFL